MAIMGTWNYRIVRYHDGSGFGLHEVYFDQDGEAWAMTKDPCAFACGPDEDPEDAITGAVKMALKDATKHDVFDEPAPGKWPGRERRPKKKVKAAK